MHPLMNRPLPLGAVEVLLAKPADEVAAALGAVAAQAAADEVALFGGAAVDLGVDVVEGGAASEVGAAISALVVPAQVDLVSERAASDEVGLHNERPLHINCSA